MMRVSSTVSANFSGSATKSRRQTRNHPGHGEFGGQDQYEQRHHQDRHGFGRQAARGITTVGFQLSGEHRHKGGAESTLGEQPAKEIGQLERDKKRVRRGTGSQFGGEQDIADIAENTADQGQPGDRSKSAGKVHNVGGNALMSAKRWRAHDAATQ